MYIYEFRPIFCPGLDRIMSLIERIRARKNKKNSTTNVGENLENQKVFETAPEKSAKSCNLKYSTEFLPTNSAEIYELSKKFYKQQEDKELEKNHPQTSAETEQNENILQTAPDENPPQEPEKNQPQTNAETEKNEPEIQPQKTPNPTEKPQQKPTETQTETALENDDDEKPLTKAELREFRKYQRELKRKEKQEQKERLKIVKEQEKLAKQEQKKEQKEALQELKEEKQELQTEIKEKQQELKKSKRNDDPLLARQLIQEIAELKQELQNLRKPKEKPNTNGLTDSQNKLLQQLMGYR